MVVPSRSARFMALVALAGLSACSHLSSCNHDQAAKTSEMQGAEVIFSSGAGELHVKVELARTAPERQLGLMYRQKLDPGTGMLFLFEHPEKLKFWMKN